jgi:hypothetical protein
MGFGPAYLPADLAAPHIDKGPLRNQIRRFVPARRRGGNAIPLALLLFKVILDHIKMANDRRWLNKIIQYVKLFTI